MAKKGKMTTIWVSWDTYERLLEVKGGLMGKDGYARSPDDVIRELITSWKEAQRELRRTYEVKKSYLFRKISQ
jgi:predicted CopG family antitoxin